MKRRTFFETMIAGAGASAATSEAQNNAFPRPAETSKGDMLYRQFGRTGETVSAIGLGGSHIGQTSPEDLAIRIVRSAIDGGITFMDNSWDYNNGDGQAEIKMGKAL